MISKDSRKVQVWGAGGGHGATTVAGLIALIAGTRVSGHDARALEWLWPAVKLRTANHSSMVVHDAGVIRDQQATGVLVLRGPCSLGTVNASRFAESFDHVVLLREPGRPLRREDAEAALRHRVDVEIPVSRNVARLADAGLLPDRALRIPELAEFRAWATRTWPSFAKQRPS